MTTTELLALPPTDKHLNWMHGILSRIKFRPEYASAQLELTYNRVKGETLDTFAVFTLADGTKTHLSSGHGKGDLNSVQAPWPETRKAFLALAAIPKEEKSAVPAPKATTEEPVAEAAAPAKPKRVRKTKKPEMNAAPSPRTDGSFRGIIDYSPAEVDDAIASFLGNDL